MSCKQADKNDSKIIADILMQIHSLKHVCNKHGYKLSAVMLDAVAEEVKMNVSGGNVQAVDNYFALHDPFGYDPKMKN